MSKYVTNFQIGSENILIKDENALPNNPADIENAVAPIIDDVVDAEYISKKVNPVVPRKVSASQIANHLVPSSEDYWYLQGGDYISDNVIVFARKAGANAPDNNVQLVKFNTDSQSVVASNTIVGYHCNSVCYNPKTGKIYANAYYDHANPSVWVNQIFVINPSTLAIESTITPVLASNAQGVYSMAVDKVTGKWYLVENIGTTSGLANRVVVYTDSTFQTIEKNIMLENWPYRINGVVKDTQGIMCVHDGIMYGLVYGLPSTIIAFDMTGKAVGKYVIDSLNQYMPITEAECLFYHGDIGNLVMGAMTVVSSGSENYKWYCTFSEVGVLNNVIEWLPVYRENLQPQNVNVYLSDTDVYGWWCETTVLKTIEAASAALSLANPGRPNGTININRTSPIVGATLNGFKGKVRGGTIHGIVCVDCDVDFTNVTILPSATYVDDSITASLVGVRSNIVLSGTTTVSNVGGTGNVTNAVAIAYGSKLSGGEKITGPLYSTDSAVIPPQTNSALSIADGTNHSTGLWKLLYNGTIAVEDEKTFTAVPNYDNYNAVLVKANAGTGIGKINRATASNRVSVLIPSYSSSNNTFDVLMIALSVDFSTSKITVLQIDKLTFSNGTFTLVHTTSASLQIQLIQI